ncbi:MAG: siderophore-interacting protein [Agrococcus casei]
MSQRPARPQRPTVCLEIIEKQWLTPHLLRLIVGGEGFSGFEPNDSTDMYCKLLFAHDGSPLKERVDMAKIRATRPSDEWPKTRTYTIRWVEPEARRLAIDFVVHGAEGVAAPWAAAAEPGDLVQFSGPGGAWSPPEAEFHLFVGDESAIPAIAAGLELLPEDARGHAVIEVGDHTLDIAHPKGVTLEWIVRGEGEYDPGARAERVLALDWPAHPSESVSVFAHGEREAMKLLRPIFKEREIPRERLSISGYWAYGRVEDAFQAEKRTEIGKV